MGCDKIVDLQLTIDGLILKENESVDDFINSLKVNSNYRIVYEIIHEELLEDNDG